MELLDFEEKTAPQPPFQPHWKRWSLLLLALLVALCLERFDIDFIPSWDWAEYWIFNICLIVYLGALAMAYDKNDTTLQYLAPFEHLGCILNWIWAGALILLILINAGTDNGVSDKQTIITPSGVFCVYESQTRQQYFLKKSYRYLPILYILEDWDNERNEIRLDTFANIVWANGEPVWNMETDRFIARQRPAIR